MDDSASFQSPPQWSILSTLAAISFFACLFAIATLPNPLVRFLLASACVLGLRARAVCLPTNIWVRVTSLFFTLMIPVIVAWQNLYQEWHCEYRPHSTESWVTWALVYAAIPAVAYAMLSQRQYTLHWRRVSAEVCWLILWLFITLSIVVNMSHKN